MFMPRAARTPFPALLLISALALSGLRAQAWGPDGHRIINRLAAEHLPPDLPEFLRAPAALEEIEYLGPEPDRWRGRAEPELNAAQAPEHFIDLELADVVGPLPRRRYDFIAALYAAGLTHPALAKDLRPEKVGLQPWVTVEVYQRLESAMRNYREQKAAGENTAPVQAAIIFYAGWLGHYAADGSNPLHTTVDYNGWAEKDNPHGYSPQPGIHSRFESAFVHDNIKASEVAALLGAPQTLADPFADYLAYLRQSHTLVERVYQLDQQNAFVGSGTPESRRFAAERLAAGASELRDLIVTAWAESARPEPEENTGTKPPQEPVPPR